jgi:HSP20 family protein
MNGTAPAVNVKENSNSYEMEVAAPGLKKEYCSVNIDNEGNLNVKIEKKAEDKKEDKKEHYLRREFAYSNYEQSYSLPENVDRDHISAKVENGVLHIELPKLNKEDEKNNQRRIEIA